MKKSDLRTALEMITEGEKASVAEAMMTESVARYQEEKRWTTNRKIQGFGIGRRLTDGERQGDMALKVYVEKKLPKAELGDKLVPKKIDISGIAGEIETDVEEIGKVEIELDTQRHRPAFPGCGLGHVEITVGTFGCLVRKKHDPNKLFILSNSHVLANEGLGEKGDLIIQPGDFDGGVAPADVIAELSEFIPFDFGQGFTNLVDAAIAKVKRKSDVVSSINVIGTPPGEPGIARVGSPVKKVGRTTGFTHGEVVDVDFKTSIPYKKPGGGKGYVRFKDQVLCTRYTAGGDSGSAVLHRDTNKILGLHYAGSTSSSIFNKIGNVLDALNIEIVTEVI